MATKSIVFAVFAAVVGASLASSTPDDPIDYAEGTLNDWWKATTSFYDGLHAKDSEIRAAKRNEYQHYLTAGDSWYLEDYITDEEQRALTLAECDEYNKNMTDKLFDAMEAAACCQDYQSTKARIANLLAQVQTEKAVRDYQILANATGPVEPAIIAFKRFHGAFFDSIYNLAAVTCGEKPEVGISYAAYYVIKIFVNIIYHWPSTDEEVEY